MRKVAEQASKEEKGRIVRQGLMAITREGTREQQR
jgi:hypothetical protein